MTSMQQVFEESLRRGFVLFLVGILLHSLPWLIRLRLFHFLHDHLQKQVRNSLRKMQSDKEEGGQKEGRRKERMKEAERREESRKERRRNGRGRKGSWRIDVRRE